MGARYAPLMSEQEAALIMGGVHVESKPETNGHRLGTRPESEPVQAEKPNDSELK
jgi:hypothetical protein